MALILGEFEVKCLTFLSIQMDRYCTNLERNAWPCVSNLNLHIQNSKDIARQSNGLNMITPFPEPPKRLAHGVKDSLDFEYGLVFLDHFLKFVLNETHSTEFIRVLKNATMN